MSRRVRTSRVRKVEEGSDTEGTEEDCTESTEGEEREGGSFEFPVSGFEREGERLRLGLRLGGSFSRIQQTVRWFLRAKSMPA